MKILITGASGLIGGRLSDYLKKKNFEVTNVSRKKRTNFLKINWRSQINLNNLCRNKDILINCAGVDIHGSKYKKETYFANCENPYKLIKAANLNRVKFFFHLSTYSIYEKKNVVRINEKSKTVGHDLHSLSKIQGENKIINYSNRYTKLIIIRSCNLFGYPKYKNKNCWKLLINYIVKNFCAKKPLIIKTSKNTYKNFSSIENFCNFFYRLIKILKKNEKKFPIIINYTSNRNYSITEIIDLIKKKVKNKQKKIYFEKKIRNEKKIKFESLYQSKIAPINDQFFNKEINTLINYCQKNKL